MPILDLEALMDNDLDTLATALYVTCDDLLASHPEWVPARPKIGIAPKISDAEIITLAVMQALLQFTNETRWLRFAHKNLTEDFPYLPRQSGYNKRVRKLATTMSLLISALAAQTSVYVDDVWVADSTPVECGRSRETTKRSDLAGWAQYGYCASHSRYFWGLRLHLVATTHGRPIGFALTGAKADERATLEEILARTPTRTGVTIFADKNYYGNDFESEIDREGITLIRPTRKSEHPRTGQQFLRPLRQTIESIFDTFKDQLGIERHGGRTIHGVCARIAQRILALTAAIWHNDHTGAPVLRSLTAYDH